MSVALPKDLTMPAPTRSGRVRAPLAIALMAVLSVQCVVALASPKMARKSARPVEQQLQAPARSEAHRPVRYVPGYQYPEGKDPRQC